MKHQDTTQKAQGITRSSVATPLQARLPAISVEKISADFDQAVFTVVANLRRQGKLISVTRTEVSAAPAVTFTAQNYNHEKIVLICVKKEHAARAEKIAKMARERPIVDRKVRVLTEEEWRSSLPTPRQVRLIENYFGIIRPSWD